MSVFKKVKEQLIDHEGLKKFPYRCSEGRLTIGIGRNLEKGLSDSEIHLLFENDFNEVFEDLANIFGSDFFEFSEERKIALIDMRFNLGPGGFRSFKKMISAILSEDWQKAAKEAKNSKWASQVQESRVEKVVSQLEKG